MESQMFDIVNSQKEKAIARFNCFRRIAKLRQFLEVLVVLGLISWSSARVPAVFRAAVGYFVAISTALFNHHVVFLIGNAIIVLLFLLCRQNNAASPPDGDLYSDYVKHSAAAAAVHLPETTNLPPPPEDAGGDVVEKRIIVVCDDVAAGIPQCDDVAAAIEKATRQIKRFERTQSEKLKREIKTTPQLRRSETQSRRNSVSSVELLETLSNEEFQRTIDAFIHQHGFQKKIKQNQFDEYEKYQFLKIA
ncbi:hypothetical protein ACS0TY_025596 [Phlomoides rotata]